MKTDSGRCAIEIRLDGTWPPDYCAMFALHAHLCDANSKRSTMTTLGDPGPLVCFGGPWKPTALAPTRWRRAFRVERRGWPRGLILLLDVTGAGGEARLDVGLDVRRGRRRRRRAHCRGHSTNPDKGHSRSEARRASAFRADVLPSTAGGFTERGSRPCGERLRAVKCVEPRGLGCCATTGHDADSPSRSRAEGRTWLGNLRPESAQSLRPRRRRLNRCHQVAGPSRHRALLPSSPSPQL